MKIATKITRGGKDEGIPPRERILAVAADLFYRHGIRAVGVESVARGAGTRIIFDQAGLLEDEAQWKHLDEGWPRNYWEPLRKYLDM